TAGCENLPAEQDLDVGQFTTFPHIDRIVDLATGQQPTAIVAGHSYEIDGALFGQDNGLISFDKQTVDVPDIVSWSSEQIIFTPTKSFNVGIALTVSNGEESGIFLMGAGANTTSSLSSVDSSVASASTSSSVTSAASTTSASMPHFADVASSDPYAAAIEWAQSHGIIQGYPDDTFRPDAIVNRAEFLKIVLTAAGAVDASSSGTSGFKDVDGMAWYAPFVAIGKSKGIIQGYSDGTFKPDQAVNFAEGLKMAYEALGVNTANVSGAWYAPYLQDATINDVLFSSDVNLSMPMSRKDVVWIAWKLSTRN
ncbi:MAG TPA: S-layer homology domain-containing protein, partial [Pirellulales bacterium]